MKLTTEDVQKIRTLAGSSAQIAAEFGVSRSTIKGIRNGTRHSSVPGYVRPIMAPHARGSAVGLSKLVEADVISIRESSMSNSELGELYGVTRQLIWQIRQGRVWAWLASHASEPVSACYGSRTGAELETHFWSYVDRSAGPDECWMWTASLRNGYGQFRVNGNTVYAHRFAFELALGAIPKGLHVCHQCDCRQCCNPNHVFLGSHADNMADMVAKGRQPRGVTSSLAKLTEQQVYEIRAATGIQKAIALRFKISRSLVKLIKSHKRWKHLSDDGTGVLSRRGRLSDDDIRKIRAGVGTQAEIAMQYGISRSHVGHIKRGRSWANVPDLSRHASEPVSACYGLEPLLLTPTEAAKVLAISERTLWTLTHKKQIPSVHLGRSVRYPLDELKRWIAAQTKVDHGQHLA